MKKTNKITLDMFEGRNPAEQMLTYIFKEVMPQEGYRLRKSQLALAKKILSALMHGRTALCEAEVGTGKTHAYLIASLIYRMYLKNEYEKGRGITEAKHKRPITIATASISLQKSIVDDYIPAISNMLEKHGKQRKYLYTEQTLQEVCLGINSMCVGAESRFFNGHTNISDNAFLCFGVKGLMDTNKRLKDAMLFNILSFMSNQLLGKGNTAASIDELYLFLTNMTAIEYIRNAMKRVRKKDSSIILASQNIEDFLIPNIREYTKPLFSIPTHQFLFNAGQINPKEFMDALQVEQSEFDLIKYPERGTCFYRCGNERYLLQVIAPEYKSVLFGKAGGR